MPYWPHVVPKAANVWPYNLDNSFGKRCRLLKTEEFSSVFALRQARSRSHLQVLHAPAPAGAGPRLGLVVSKKAAKRANKRNYMKRVIREWFRCNKHRLPPKDFVVRVKTLFDHRCADTARAELAELMLPKNRRNG